MDADYSKEAFFSFLDFVVEKGLVKAETARTWRVASSKLMGDLSEAEQADVRIIDVDTAARRVANKQPGALSPESLNVYQKRVNLAVQEFVKWKENPSTYKPRGNNGRSRGKLSENGNSRQEGKKPSDATASASPTKETRPVSAGLTLDFPIRPDFMAQVVIPRDLKLDEAKRLCAFLSTVAVDLKPEQILIPN